MRRDFSIIRPILAAIASFAVFSAAACAATFESPNFVVTAPGENLAREVAETAERCRDELAELWLGRKLKRWYEPCSIRVKVGQLGAGGATTFAFDRGHVFGWRMTVQGTRERILDSVIPHEVSHTIFATHFRRPLPRWADEGAATLVEHESERNRQRLLLNEVWESSRRIPLDHLLAMTEYPTDMHSVMTLYAEGYSLADFLVQAGGRQRFLAFLDAAHRRGWETAIRQHYSLGGITELEQRWTGWITSGSPTLDLPEGQQLADSDQPVRTAGGVVIRSQSPDSVEPASAMLQAETGHSGVGLTHRAPERNLGFDHRHQARNQAAARNDGWIPGSEFPDGRRADSPRSLPTADGERDPRGRPPFDEPASDDDGDASRRDTHWSEFPRGDTVFHKPIVRD